LLLGAAWGIWQAQIGLRADVLFEQSQTLQEAWTEAPDSLHEDDWLSAGQDLLAALALNAGEAEYLHQYGILLSTEQNLLGDALTRQELQRIASNAQEAHRLGIRQRPASPIGWTNFALSKALAGQLDGEFDRALERSNSLGPWEKENHRVVAAIAMNFWTAMSNNGRYYSLAPLQRALSTPGFDQPVLNTLGGSAFLTDQLCPVLDQASLTEIALQACQAQ
jgi:hypothetical protein